jgi:hypothetical protein
MINELRYIMYLDVLIMRKLLSQNPNERDGSLLLRKLKLLDGELVWINVIELFILLNN